MMSWNRLEGQIVSMAPDQRRAPAQPLADRFVLAAMFLQAGEEATEEFLTATGIRYSLDEIEDLDDGGRMAWYVRRP